MARLFNTVLKRVHFQSVLLNEGSTSPWGVLELCKGIFGYQ